MLSPDLKEQMLFLLDMGYINFKKNEALLMKHKGQLELVVNELALLHWMASVLYWLYC